MSPFETELSQALDWLVRTVPLFVAAALCGSLLGLERRRRHAAAGMKTYALVCLGATAYMSSGHLILESTGLAGDPTRMAGQIVTGIGFLGAGAILRGDAGVSGLTTAAGVWFTGAVGVLIGCNLPLAGLALTLFAIALLYLLSKIEAGMEKNRVHPSAQPLEKDS
ncbi:MAG: MgtC/SapB family protein [Thermoanaerobaculia bacterium]|nr:MgtC/SapB family protein [Thermoanaerobaculia bacterium]